MTDRCYDVEAFGELIELQDGDARLSHLHACPRCRARYAEYRAFMEQPAGVPAGDLSAAERAMARALSNEMDASLDVPSRNRGGGFVSRWMAALSGPALRPALGVAAIAVVVTTVFITTRPQQPDTPVLRGDRPVAESATAPVTRPPQVSETGVELSWHPVTRADAYAIRLLTPELEEFARLGPLTDTTLTLTSLPQRMERGSLVLWQVVALADGSEIGASRTGRFEAP